MTAPQRRPDLAEQVAALRKEVKRLEQRRALNYTDDGLPSFPDGINAGGTTLGTPAGATPAPGGLALAWSSFFEEISIDASWAATAGASRYEIRLIRHTGPGAGDRQLEQVAITRGLTYRFTAGVRPNTTYTIALVSLDALGTPSAEATAQIATGSDISIPAPPTGLVVTAGIRTVVVAFNESAEPDVANGAGLYEVDLHTDAGFGAGTRTIRTGATIVPFSDLPAGGATWYARARAIDASGNESANSATASSATAPVSTDDIITAGLSAAVIKFGTMSGDRITANTLSAAAIKTSTLAAAVITLGTGGRLQVGTGAPGLFIDDAGIRLFNSAGTRTAWLDGLTGNIELVGNLVAGSSIVGASFRTAATGRRIELGTDATGKIYWYSGDAQEAGPGSIGADINGITPMLELISPRTSAGNQVRIRMTGKTTAGVEANVLIGTYSSGGALQAAGTGQMNIYPDLFARAAMQVTGAATFLDDLTVGISGRMRLFRTNDLGLGTTGHALQIGQDPNQNLAFDTNEIQSRNNGAADVLYVNAQGGNVHIGDDTYGYQLGYEGTGSRPTFRPRRAGSDNSLRFGDNNILARNRADNAYQALSASAFTVNSSRKVKRDVGPLDRPALEILRGAPASKWRYAAKGIVVDADRFRAGPMAEDLPSWATMVDEVTGELAVDLATQVGLLWAAANELDAAVARLDPTLRERVDAIEATPVVKAALGGGR